MKKWQNVRKIIQIIRQTKIIILVDYINVNINIQKGLDGKKLKIQKNILYLPLATHLTFCICQKS